MLCGLIFLFCFCADLLATGLADPPGSPPAPALIQVQNAGLSLVLRCQAPQDHKGRLFKLYRTHELVDTVQLETEQTQAEFHLQGGAMEQENYYCCQYDNSMISPYTTIRAPPRPIRPLTPPHLLVSPPSGRVLPGQVMQFHCQAPPSSLGHLPLTYLLSRRPLGAHSDQEVGRSADPHFKVGPVSQEEGGTYTCLYQLTLSEGVKNSPLSSPVVVHIAAHLPAPQLSHGDEGMLICTGSPSYPGAHFSLYQQGADVPSARRHAPMVKHSARFAVREVRGQAGGGFQCQYSVLLGESWAHSELSSVVTLPCPTGSPSCSTLPTSYIPPPKAGDRVDLALIIGSISAALLFMLVVIIVGFAVHKHAKAAAVKRRQRQQDMFWQQVHSRDHIVDLTLQRVNFSPADHFAEESTEPIYDCPFTTFTNPFEK